MAKIKRFTAVGRAESGRESAQKRSSASMLPLQVRGKTAVVLVAAAEQLDEAALTAFGLERLVASAGALVTDNTPDARAAAKQLLPLIHRSFSATASGDAGDSSGTGGEGETRGAAAPQQEGSAESPRQPTPWESFVRSHTSASAAIAFLKICT